MSTLNRNKGTALITGASSGIGEVYADRLAKRGYDLILVARDEQKLNAVAAELRAATGRNVEVLKADLTKSDELSRVEKRLESDSAITLVVNNAGAAAKGGFLDGDSEGNYNLVELNIVAPTKIAGSAVKNFAKNKTENAAIINLSSVVAFIPQFVPGVYSATRSYTLALSQSLQAELANTGIYVQAVLPQGTKTKIWERSGRGISDTMMEVDVLVNAALVGFDRKEAVTIPSLHDLAAYEALENANNVLISKLINADAAERYTKATASV